MYGVESNAYVMGVFVTLFVCVVIGALYVADPTPSKNEVTIDSIKSWLAWTFIASFAWPVVVFLGIFCVLGLSVEWISTKIAALLYYWLGGKRDRSKY